MTVAELITRLNALPRDLEVCKERTTISGDPLSEPGYPITDVRVEPFMRRTTGGHWIQSGKVAVVLS